jgi:3-hydroxyacyl-CoA dehydrogenase
MNEIKTVGVCGAGVMGSQLAALLAGAGCKVYLFDLAQELAEKGLAGALAARPPAFYLPRFARNVVPCHYDAHLERLAECDWVVEAIAERLDWKKDLYGRIAPLLGKGAVLSSNTSGISLAELTADLDEDLRRRFLITHFFNPPRYMRLVETVAERPLAEDVEREMSAFLGEVLGKGVVPAKDTPNFIANRIGIFGMMLALRLTRKMRLTVEQVDALTGPVMGRPKSATFRTADLVGLDTLAFVARTAYDKCEDDESRDLFALPDVLARLVQRKSLGQKTGEGFYKKAGREILSLDLDSLEYRPRQKSQMDGIGVARRFTDPGKKLSALVYNPDPAGEFAWELTVGALAYAARRVGEIADDVVAVDRAMKWGFGWQLGPFEAWDAIGVEKSVRRMEREGKEVPKLVRYLLEKGRTKFYGRDSEGWRTYFHTCSGELRPVPEPAGAVFLSDAKARGGEILRNWSASLVDVGDGVGCVEFHSALQPEFHPVDGAILDLVAGSLRAAAERGMRGLVISHEGANFCAGANLALILELARRGRFRELEAASRAFQDLTQAIRYAPFPVVAAPFSVCVGGGYELVAACDRVVALAELYCGAVEVGVGLIPGAGGNLRLLANLAERYPAEKHGPMPAVQKAFETIGYAKVSGSAHEAVEIGYLTADTPVVLSRDHLIAKAKAEVLRLAEGYRAPEPRQLRLPGAGGRLAISAAVDNLQKAGTISEHDALVGKKLAYVLTGGERAGGVDPVDEPYLLDLERETFVSLAGEPKSQERMAYMLKTGKPLRN